MKIPSSPTASASGNDVTASSDQGDPDAAPAFSSAPTTPDIRGRRFSNARSTSTLDRSSSPRSHRLQRPIRSRPASEQRVIESSKPPRESLPRKSDDPAFKQERPPQLTVQEPTPDQPILTPLHQKREVNVIEEEFEDAVENIKDEPKPETRPSTGASAPLTPAQRPPLSDRAQSLIPAGQQGLIRELLQDRPGSSRSAAIDYFTGAAPLLNPGMVQRKIWVKRPGASATLVTVTEDDVVDDVREAILRKYGNSLGRSLDAPDITLRIVARDQSGRPGVNERILGPEEQICRTLDTYYPGSQTVEDALLIDIPQRKTTPRPSPRYGYSMPHYVVDEQHRAVGEPTEYFPPMPAIPSPTLALPNHAGSVHHQPVHAMSVLSTGQVPALPSPGGRTYKHHGPRPRYGRNHASSPTVIGSIAPSQQVVGILPSSLSQQSSYRSRSPIDELLSSDSNKQLVNGVQAPAPPPLPTPPAPTTEQKSSHTPPGRVSSPRPGQKPRRSKKITAPKEPSNATSLSAGLLDGTVPPINVLIVEDNVINLRLLEAFIKRLKVRWKTAVNGREAVNKWRAGGFHLVLMDIQLPIMSGLEATREIRRLERINNIGVFSSPVSSDKGSPSVERKAEENGEKMHDGKYQPEGDDVLEARSLFKSPVIVVALTASSLQSDRHEALAAGCNDFLTKVSYLAVNFFNEV